MYRLQIYRADVWTILDDQDEIVFQGALQECEFWLDRQETLLASRSASEPRQAGFRQWLEQWWQPPGPISPLLHQNPPAARHR